MALIPIDNLTELKTATAVKKVADNAIADQEMLRVAHAINSAANTGIYDIEWCDTLSDSCKSTLEGKGYTVTKIVVGVDFRYKISWR